MEPSIFIPDDFETVRNQITLIRQYGFPATYALKYNALIEPRYQELLYSYTNLEDEIRLVRRNIGAFRSEQLCKLWRS